MKNKKAFTMVELLAVLVILGIIMAIAVPTISYFLKGNSSDYYSKLERTISASSQDFFNDYRVNLPKDIGNIKKINITTLTSQKYITDILGIDKKNCEGDVVAQKLSNGNYSYTTCLKCEKKQDGSYGYTSTAKECGYSEENNNKYTILIDGLGDKNSIRIPQAESYTIPNAKVYVNNQALSSTIKPTPISINTNILTTYKIYYTYRTLVKELQIKVYDPKKPVMNNISATANGTNYVSGVFTNKDVKVNLSATDWTTSSVYGSGIDHFEYQINGGSVQKVNASTGDNKTYAGSFNLTTNGTYNISAKAIDKEGNISDSKTFVVKIDKIAPTGTITVASTNSSYKALTVRATINANDNTGGSLVKQMCISESNNVNNCSWTNYTTTKNMTLSGTLDGRVRTIYYWFKDTANNISSTKNITYTPYKEGTEVNLSAWSSCSKVCGGGTQTKTATDKYTGKVITSKNQTQSCNTMDCCSSTTITGYGSCSKACGGGTKAVYRKSNYNGQNCSKTTETLTCNTQNCCSDVNYSSWSNWGACSKSCGGGTQTRTRTATSKYNGQSCSGGGIVLSESQSCNTHSCTQYRYRDIKAPTVKKTSYSVKSKVFYTCICSSGTVPLYTGKTMCNYSSDFPSCELLHDTSYTSSKSSYKCVPSEYTITSTVPDYNKCVAYTTVSGMKICTQYGTKVITTTNKNTPSCSSGTYKYCDSMEDIIVDKNANITGCEKKTTTCDSGWTLSGGKCYGPWSAWSSNKVTASSTREVQTKQG